MIIDGDFTKFYSKFWWLESVVISYFFTFYFNFGIQTNRHSDSLQLTKLYFKNKNLFISCSLLIILSHGHHPHYPHPKYTHHFP